MAKQDFVQELSQQVQDLIYICKVQANQIEMLSNPQIHVDNIIKPRIPIPGDTGYLGIGPHG